MKRVLLSFAALSIWATMPALSTETAHLTTKEYVDTGLRAVYNRAKTMDEATNTKLDELTVYVGAPANGNNPATGLTKQVSDLSADIAEIEGQIEYQGDNRGVSIDNRKVGIVGLTDDTGQDNKMYVFKNNQATKLDVADTWSSVMTNKPTEDEGM